MAMDDELDAREAARAKRRDRDAEAQHRAPMNPGMGKVFKQIGDKQEKAANAARPNVGKGSKTAAKTRTTTRAKQAATRPRRKRA
jgi:hypothetical protein